MGRGEIAVEDPHTDRLTPYRAAEAAPEIVYPPETTLTGDRPARRRFNPAPAVVIVDVKWDRGAAVPQFIGTARTIAVNRDRELRAGRRAAHAVRNGADHIP